MALRGPAAKANKHGRTPTADWTDVPDVAYTGPSPELPKLPGRRKWNDLVFAWWEQVRTMPHCANWQPGDWMFALETALMKQIFWTDYSEGDMKTSSATEIRRREDQIGTTAEARRKLRIRYIPVREDVDGEDLSEEPAIVLDQEFAGLGGTVTPLESRRRRLAG